MLRNITLSADEYLIQKARKKAQKAQTTLNAQFRQWLENYINIESNAGGYEDLMNQLSYTKPTDRYSREDLNER